MGIILLLEIILCISVYPQYPNHTKYLGKLKYFTNLNSKAIKGDDFPEINHDSRARENSEVVIIYTDSSTTPFFHQLCFAGLGSNENKRWGAGWGPPVM